VAERFHIEVDADQFDKLSRPTQPLPAVAEPIWNSLDAEAEVVDVALGLTEMEAVETVQVVDDGHGMTYDDAIHDFRKLGGSWKKGRKT
jgi:predicted component of type VI protein secretion system